MPAYHHKYGKKRELGDDLICKVFWTPIKEKKGYCEHVSVGSIGSMKPINFQSRSLNLINFWAYSIEV